MKNLTAYEWLALILVIVGALNWGLIGIFRLDLVATIFGDMSLFSRLIYSLVGVAAIFLAFISPRLSRKQS